MSVDISLNELTTAEKLELMERLWVDLSRNPQDVPSPAWHGVVLAERREAVRQGRTTFVAWEEARQRLLDSPRMKIRILPEAECGLDIGADFDESQTPGAGTYLFASSLTISTAC